MRRLSASLRRTALASLAPLLALLAPAAAHAAGTVELSLSYYEPSFDTKVRLDSSSLGSGTAIDFENDLGLENDAREFRGELALRLGRRSRVVFDYLDFKRSGSGTIDRQVQFGDTLFEADVELDSRVDTSMVGVAYLFSLVNQPSSELAVSVGARWLDVHAEISGLAAATANGVPVGSAPISEVGDASGPVPLVGLRGSVWLTQRIRLVADARYMDLETFFGDFEGWKGSMTDYSLGVDWLLTPNVAFGVAYAGTAVDAEFSDTDFSGKIDYSWDGFRAGVTLGL